MLYEVVILEEATDDEPEKLVLKPTAVIANDEQGAAVNAVLENSDLEIDKSRMRVLVRPFM